MTYDNTIGTVFFYSYVFAHQNLLLLLLVLLPCDVCLEEAQSRNKRDCTIAVYTREKSRTLREIFEKGGGGAEHGSAGEGGREGAREGWREG